MTVYSGRRKICDYSYRSVNHQIHNALFVFAWNSLHLFIMLNVIHVFYKINRCLASSSGWFHSTEKLLTVYLWFRCTVRNIWLEQGNNMVHIRVRVLKCFQGSICIDIHALCSDTPHRPKAAKSCTRLPLSCHPFGWWCTLSTGECLMES